MGWKDERLSRSKEAIREARQEMRERMLEDEWFIRAIRGIDKE